MSSPRSLVTLVLLIAMAVPAAAQSRGKVNLMPGSPNQPELGFANGAGLAFGNGALYQSMVRGPLFAATPGMPTVDIFGAEFGSRTGAAGYDAWFTPLTSVDYTQTYGVAQRGWDLGIAEQRYRAAAWLATQYVPGDPARVAEWPAYQSAMWSLMGQGGSSGVSDPFGFPGGQFGRGGPRDYLQTALTNASTVDADAWTVVSDASGNNPELLVVQSVETVQNVESVVPEPQTVILLVTGLLALGAVAYFRGISV